jgi:general secretion pathway protein D
MNSARRIDRSGRQRASVRPAGVLVSSLRLCSAPISRVAPALGRAALIALLILSLGIPANSDQAGSAFKRGQKAENHNDYDTAFQEYSTAHRLKPDDARYLVSFLRARNTAAQNHVEKGQMLRSQGNFQDAINEFKHASDIDDTNAAARQEMDAAAEMLRKENEKAAGIKIESSLAMKAAQTQGPVELEPISNAPLTLRMTTTTDNVYKTIGKLAGINVLLDLDLTGDFCTR